jgi:glycosyltransferase involved in cell wall biosynthesis
MKVLVVSQHFWPENFGINNLVRSLVEKGISVDVLTGKPNYPTGNKFPGYAGWGFKREKWMGANVYRVPLAARKSGAISLGLNYLSFILSGLLFGPLLLRKNHYDAILVYGTSPILQAIPAIFLGWIKRCGVAVWVQDLWPESLSATGYIQNPHILKYVEMVVRYIYRHTDLLLVQSKAFESRVAPLAGGTPIAYYPNSVDPAFAAAPEIEMPDIPQLNSGFNIVFAGNIGAGQAVDVIIGAAVILKDYTDVRFVVFGNGSRWEWMREEAQKHGLSNLHLLGRYPSEMMPGFMKKASALLVTLSDQPIFAATVPSKVQAYMAAGKPILACLNGEGARLVLEADAGLAIRAEDPEALAEAVLRLREMVDGEREKLGENGRRYSKEHFDLELLTDQLTEHFRMMSKYCRSGK